MASFLPDSVKAILFGLIVIVFALSRLARAFPNVGWLQIFRLPFPKMSAEERARRRRTANQIAALELVLVGFALPLLYFVSTLMLFNEPETIPTLIVGVASLLCIGLGIWTFFRNP